MSQKSLLCLWVGLGEESFKQDSRRLNRHDRQPVPPRCNNMVMGVADESDHISNASQMPNVVRDDLVQRVRVRRVVFPTKHLWSRTWSPPNFIFE